MEKFKQLRVWKKAHQLVLDVYKITDDFPKHEMFCLVSQMRRAVISISANIAEGSRRKSKKDRLRFHNMADTSLEELKYYFLLSYDLKYISLEAGKRLTVLAREVGKMLTRLNKSL